MNRRRLLKVGGGTLGVLGLGAAYGAYRYMPPSPSQVIRPPAELASAFLDSIDAATRRRVLVDYDHPYRQYHNRGVWAGTDDTGITIAAEGFSWEQRSLLVDLMHSGMSADGRGIIPNQLLLRYTDAVANNLLICGEPGSEYCQILFTGPHLNLRIGGRNREGVAFGGPQIYGDQTGNEDPGIPGNIYRPRFLAANALFDSLSPALQQLALQEDSPIQTQIEVKGARGTFAGVPVAELTKAQQQQVKGLIDDTFAPYPAEDTAYAWECLNANGGLDSLHFAIYADSRYDESGGFQNYRIEGPAAAFYFQGIPHVHGFFNVAMDAEAPLSVGEVIGENPKIVEGAALAELFERAMQKHTGADFAYYAKDSAVGRLPAGTVRSGDIYNAESWENTISLITVLGSDIGGEFAAQLAADVITVEAQRRYTIATDSYLANNRLNASFGDAEVTGDAGLIRNAVMAYAKTQGFA